MQPIRYAHRSAARRLADMMMSPFEQGGSRRRTGTKKHAMSDGELRRAAALRRQRGAAQTEGVLNRCDTFGHTAGHDERDSDAGRSGHEAGVAVTERTVLVFAGLVRGFPAAAMADRDHAEFRLDQDGESLRNEVARDEAGINKYA
ncbi:hypothetical protein AUC70_04215 [Methyloceanibacter stevinii]|uniref:Uncharacterized protein n=1 Tax=Methyloceanibacter stevinii TaxID=1774970 RepID=A0A1E3VN65_9HYPH|nr:hypothetical protein AUC70_04215 [Methyloceanibacter stevinii]